MILLTKLDLIGLLFVSVCAAVSGAPNAAAITRADFGRQKLITFTWDNPNYYLNERNLPRKGCTFTICDYIPSILYNGSSNELILGMEVNGSTTRVEFYDAISLLRLRVVFTPVVIVRMVYFRNPNMIVALTERDDFFLHSIDPATGAASLIVRFIRCGVWSIIAHDPFAHLFYISAMDDTTEYLITVNVLSRAIVDKRVVSFTSEEWITYHVAYVPTIKKMVGIYGYQWLHAYDIGTGESINYAKITDDPTIAWQRDGQVFDPITNSYYSQALDMGDRKHPVQPNPRLFQARFLPGGNVTYRFFPSSNYDFIQALATYAWNY